MQQSFKHHDSTTLELLELRSPWLPFHEHNFLDLDTSSQGFGPSKANRPGTDHRSFMGLMSADIDSNLLSLFFIGIEKSNISLACIQDPSLFVSTILNMPLAPLFVLPNPLSLGS